MTLIWSWPFKKPSAWYFCFSTQNWPFLIKLNEMIYLYNSHVAPSIYHPVAMFLFNLTSFILTLWYFFKFTACTSGSASVLPAGDKAELKSPGYPYDVPEHLSCRWLLEAPEGQVTSTFNFLYFTNLQLRCSLPVRPHFPVHVRGKYKKIEYPFLYASGLRSTSCSMHYTTPEGHTWMGQVFLQLLMWILEYCANQNVVPDLLQVRSKGVNPRTR